MPRSIEEIQNDIAKVKAEIALKNKYMNGYSAPTSNRGWGAYFQDDKTVHQKALDEQTAWARALQQQEFLAAQADENRRLQEAEGEANRKMQEKIASMNKTAAAEDRREEAKLRLEKLLIAKSDAERVGGDTRQLDAEINHLMDKYGFDNVATEPYDATNKVEYKTAKYKDYNSAHNTVEELEDAMNELSKYDTPEAINLYVKLERERIRRERMDKNGLTLQTEIDNFDPSTGDLSTYLTRAGYKTAVSGNGYDLIDPKGMPIKRYKESRKGGNTGNTGNTGSPWAPKS